MKNIAVFASGTGSNAKKLIEYFTDSDIAKIAAVFTNNPNAGVINIAMDHKLPVVIFNRTEFWDPSFANILKNHHIDYIILAGFLWLLPEFLIQAFPKKIINIHPALLPKYGGKGMYGTYVHEAVKNAGEAETGITIHYVDEKYDSGDIIFQKKVALTPDDDPLTIAQKVQQLEHEHFPKVVEQIITQDQS